MKIEVEVMIDDGTEGVVWGMSPEGHPVLVAFVAGKRVKIGLTSAQAKEVGCGAIYAACALEQLRAGPQPGALVAPDGRPLPSKIGGTH